MGEAHRDTLASLGELASLYRLQQRYDEAESLLVKAVEIARRALGDDDLAVGTYLYDLANLKKTRGEIAQAEPLVREALRIKRATLPKDHLEVAMMESFLGGCLTDLGRYDEAEALLVESYPAIRAVNGVQGRKTRGALQRIIRLFEVQGETDLAAEWRAKLPVDDSSPEGSGPARDSEDTSEN